MAAASEFLVLFELCTALGKSALDLDLDKGFIAHGGDSLSAVSLAVACKGHGLGLPRDKILKSQTLRGLFSMISCLPVDQDPLRVKRYLASKLGLGSTAPSDTATPTTTTTTHSHGFDTTPSEASSSYESAPDITSSVLSQAPLTEMQRLFIRGSLSQPGANNIIVHSETYKTEDIPKLKEAWRQVIESEPIFNQDFPQWNHTLDADLGSASFDWADSITDHDTEDHAGIESFFRVAPVDSDAALSEITWTVHHSLIDGYSASVLLEKVLRIANGQQPPPSGPSFSKFARELALFRMASLELGSAYWAGKQDDLSNAQHELLLPSPRSNGTLTHRGSATVTIDIAAVSQEVHAKAKSFGITPAAFFNAAWALTAAHYADSDLVLFGAVLWGRSLPLPGALEVIGPLLNTLPFMVRLDRTKTAAEFLQSTFEQLVELEDYQWTTAEENGFRRAFDTALSVQPALPGPQSARSIHPLARETRQEHEVPLGVRIDPRREVSLDYHVDRFSEENVQRLGKTFRRALSLLLDSDRTINHVLGHLNPEPAVEWLQHVGNCSASTLLASSTSEDLVTFFERRAREMPDGVAIEKGCDTMSYRDMDRTASRVAARLTQEGIAPGEVVCVYADRSMSWLCAIFGILKAGGVYCSMDPMVPQDVRDRIFGLSGARLFITAKPCQLRIVPEACPASFTVQSVLGGEGDGTMAEFDAVQHHRRVAQPQTPAYVCFTSGSTGTPKGVLCTHAGLVAFQSSLDVRLFAAPGRRIAHVMSVAFDGSIHELFSALTHGATLVLPSGSDPFGHLRSVDAAILTPSLARVLDPDEFERLKWVYLVGEPVPQSVCDRWASVKQLYNMYGPTEGTCGATIKRLLPRQPVTVGVPNPTTRVYVLSSNKTLSPPGAIGELYLAGVQVARGYLHLPDQTQQRFVPDTLWAPGTGETMYRTGDRGYWTEDGEMVLLGRRDREIKLRGYRLDLGDLEMRIVRACPSLQAVAVAVACCGDQLVAMVQPRDVDVALVREEIAKALPHYAVPHATVAVDELPVTGAGKVDYKAVAAAATRGFQQHRDGPHAVLESDNQLSTPAEFAVAKAYQMALGTAAEDVEITASSNFVDLGGHSLRQLELLRCLSATFNVSLLPLSMVLAHQTVRDLAKAIQGATAVISPAPLSPQGIGQHAPSSVSDEERATPMEVEWMTKYKKAGGVGTSSFNVCSSSTFDASVIDTGRLIDAWNAVLARHPLLSYLYTYRGPGEVIRTNPGYVPRVQTPCASGFDLWTEANRPFDLQVEQPVRVFITENRLTVLLSHVVADYTALGILMRDASDAYSGSLQLDKPPTRSCSSTAKVWCDAPSQESLDFWRAQLQDRAARPAAPFSAQPRQHGYSGTSVLSIIDAETVSSMLQYSASTNTTLQQLALACIALCLDHHTSPAGGGGGGTDIILGVPHINRHTAEDLDTFGLFLQPLPVRITYPPISGDDQRQEEEQQDFITTVKAASQAALAHAIPWHQLLHHLHLSPSPSSPDSPSPDSPSPDSPSPDSDYPNHPLFDVMVTMHDFRPTTTAPSQNPPPTTTMMMKTPGFGEPRLVWSDGAKFKLLCEFTALPSGRMVLRLEVDGGVVGVAERRWLGRAVPVVMRLLARGEGWGVVRGVLGGMRAGMGESEDGDDGLVVDPMEVFGKGLSEV